MPAPKKSAPAAPPRKPPAKPATKAPKPAAKPSVPALKAKMKGAENLARRTASITQVVTPKPDARTSRITNIEDPVQARPHPYPAVDPLKASIADERARNRPVPKTALGKVSAVGEALDRIAGGVIERKSAQRTPQQQADRNRAGRALAFAAANPTLDPELRPAGRKVVLDRYAEAQQQFVQENMRQSVSKATARPEVKPKPAAKPSLDRLKDKMTNARIVAAGRGGTLQVLTDPDTSRMGSGSGVDVREDFPQPRGRHRSRTPSLTDRIIEASGVKREGRALTPVQQADAAKAATELNETRKHLKSVGIDPRLRVAEGTYAVRSSLESAGRMGKVLLDAAGAAWAGPPSPQEKAKRNKALRDNTAAAVDAGAGSNPKGPTVAQVRASRLQAQEAFSRAQQDFVQENMRQSVGAALDPKPKRKPKAKTAAPKPQ